MTKKHQTFVLFYAFLFHLILSTSYVYLLVYSSFTLATNTIFSINDIPYCILMLLIHKFWNAFFIKKF